MRNLCSIVDNLDGCCDLPVYRRDYFGIVVRPAGEQFCILSLQCGVVIKLEHGHIDHRSQAYLAPGSRCEIAASPHRSFGATWKATDLTTLQLDVSGALNLTEKVFDLGIAVVLRTPGPQCSVCFQQSGWVLHRLHQSAGLLTYVGPRTSRLLCKRGLPCFLS